MSKKVLCKFAMLLIAIAVSSAYSQAQVITGQDNFGNGFDGNGDPLNYVQGVDWAYKTRTVSPDNSTNLTGGIPGAFPGSRFDVFGVTSHGLNFDLDDDTTDPNNPFDDFIGFAVTPGQPGDMGNFFGVEDLENNDNGSGFGTVDWEFDLAPGQGLDPYDIHRICVDVVAYGDFEQTDAFIFSGGLDQVSKVFFEFALTQAQDDENTIYICEMAGGQQRDWYFNPFWNSFLQGPWDDLILNGENANYGFHIDDDGGANDDTGAMDGFINGARLVNPTQTTRGIFDKNAFNGSGSNTTQLFPYMDPLIEQQQGQDVALNNQKQRFCALCKGTGDCFFLRFEAFNNGSSEVFAFDNVVLESAVLGDANGDGILNFDDLDPFVLALFDPAAYALAFPNVDPNFVMDFNCDGSLTFDDLDPFVNKLFN